MEIRLMSRHDILCPYAKKIACTRKLLFGKGAIFEEVL